VVVRSTVVEGDTTDGRTVVVVVDVVDGSTSRLTLIQPVIGRVTALKIMAAATVALMFFIVS
jgi:hypothetical protein